MGLRTNTVLTALNYMLDNQIEKKKKKEEDQRKLDMIQKELELRDMVDRNLNPQKYALQDQQYQLDYAKNANEIKRQPARFEIQGILDELEKQKAQRELQNQPWEDLKFQYANNLIVPENELKAKTTRNQIQSLDYDYNNFDKKNKEAAELADLAKKVKLGELELNQVRINSIKNKDAIAKQIADLRISSSKNGITSKNINEVKSQLRLADYNKLLELRKDIADKISIMEKDFEENPNLKIKDRESYLLHQDTLEYIDSLLYARQQNNGNLFGFIGNILNPLIQVVKQRAATIEAGLNQQQNDPKQAAIEKAMEDKKKKKTSPAPTPKNNITSNFYR